MKNKLSTLIILFVAVMYSTDIASCTNDEAINEVENDTIYSTAEDYATQIMKNAIVISSYDYIYAFGISKMVIIGNKAYINYGANKNKLDGDLINNNNEYCCSIINIEDLRTTVLEAKTLSKVFPNGTNAPAKAVVGYETKTITRDARFASLALLRLNDNNPYYCYSFVNPDEQVYNYITCQLEYTDKCNNNHIVDFTINNYRQMLVDMGYNDKYVASTKDAYNNINLHYDWESDSYYAFITTNSEKTDLPFIMMRSNDMSIWSPVMSLGDSYGAGEIATVIKGDVVYMSYRTFSKGTKWLVYNLKNKSVINKGSFSECRNVQSKPDTFTFGNDVYMAVNVYPSIYRDNMIFDPYTIRQEINIYKIINGSPELLRKIYNPDGINYFSFQEASNGRVYLTFSEDRRHLYKRLFSNVSFVDATDFFTGY